MIPAALRRVLRRQAHVSPAVRALMLAVVIAMLATYCGGWYGNRLIEDLRSLGEPKPIVTQTRDVGKADLAVFEKRWREFASAKPNEHALLEVTGDDMQMLVRQRTPIADGLIVRVEKDRAVVRFAYPMKNVPLLGSQFAGTWLNLSGAARIRLEDGVPVIEFKNLYSRGQQLEDDRRRLVEYFANAWLRTHTLPYKFVLGRVQATSQDHGAVMLQQ